MRENALDEKGILNTGDHAERTAAATTELDVDGEDAFETLHVIALSAHRDPDGRIAVAVADNGPGIPPEQREKVFVPFYTTKRQGSGIGLTIVRQIATAHGAKVDISSAPGSGASVTLRF